MAKRNFSRQRQAILDMVMQEGGHPSAETVYQKLRESWPQLSLGTVYRNLNLLADEGELRRVHQPASEEHFDGRADPHMHMTCESCGAIMDVEGDVRSVLSFLKQQPGTAEVTGVDLMLRGRCPACAAQQSHHSDTRTS